MISARGLPARNFSASPTSGAGSILEAGARSRVAAAANVGVPALSGRPGRVALAWDADP